MSKASSGFDDMNMKYVKKANRVTRRYLNNKKKENADQVDRTTRLFQRNKKKQERQVHAMREDVTGFADASAPSNSNYQTELSPTQTKAKKKKSMKVKEAYERRLVKLASINVVTSLDEVTDILEKYEPSTKHMARTKYLVQPNLSKKLQARLAARKALKISNGYTPSKGTLGLAAVRKAQMSRIAEDAENDPEMLGHHHGYNNVKANIKFKGEALKKYNEAKKRGEYDRKEDYLDESADKHIITFSHNNSAYRVHKVGCPAAKARDGMSAWMHEGDTKSALAYCHEDESEKAGKPTKANAAICKCAKPMKEENLTEISKKTLGSYVQKAASDLRVKSYSRGMKAGLSWGKKRPPDENADKDEKKVEKRQIGISRATNRLTKEETLTELSKKTLGSYIKKAAKDASYDSNIQGYKTGLKNLKAKSSDGKTSVPYNNSEDSRKETKRHAGIARATDKLTKEELLIDGKSNQEIKKFAGEGKAGLKRKYLGASRGRTVTGKPAHPIEVDPVMRADGNLNKVVK